MLVLPGILRETFRIEVDARDYGFEPTDTPRTDRSVGSCLLMYQLDLVVFHCI